MGLFSSNVVAKSQVWLGGLSAYAESGGDESLSAQVELTETKSQPSALPLLVTGGASRLFSTLRTEPRYIEAFVDLVETVRDGLNEAENLSEFRVGDHVGDPRILATGGEFLLAQAEVAGIVPVLEYQLGAPAEAGAAMTLRIRKRSGPSVMLTFHGGPKNPLVSIAAWAATVDECARTQSAAKFLPPTLGGLDAILQIWEEGGNPQRVMDGYRVEQIVAAETLERTP